MERKIIAELMDYAFETMNSTNSTSEHFFWKGQYLAYSNVLNMIDEKMKETIKRIDEEVENLTVEQQKKLLNAIFDSKRELIDDDGYEFDDE